MKLKNLIGQKFGRLTVIGRSEDKSSRPYWDCVCECSNTCVIRGQRLVSGVTSSCGCKRREEKLTHGMSQTSAYYRWYNMINRCTKPEIESYKNYGGRGIKVCSRWRSFEKFHSDMGDPPTSDHTLERIDNDKDYFPENCRWATRKEQARNRRTNRTITLGSQTKCLSDWSEDLGVSLSTIEKRINRGWSGAEIITGR